MRVRIPPRVLSKRSGMTDYSIGESPLSIQPRPPLKAGPVVFYAVEVALEFIVTVRASGVKTGKCYKYLLGSSPPRFACRVIYVVSSTG